MERLKKLERWCEGMMKNFGFTRNSKTKIVPQIKNPLYILFIFVKHNNMSNYLKIKLWHS
ncbi:hypothetical protein B0A58_08080 [Flavobacterium branchiophilum NBRC 15030 = ATCC 35035]|nr:hypothetical protein B0A58_08080 [Flavobacterium branchiophilum NBRC 15030 = ATCC 35035]GEM54198.1 hypothetical protein FB1_04190 [Flavobacterium branchiophilum NBRC 15030 = ATCC 35035]